MSPASQKADRRESRRRAERRGHWSEYLAAVFLLLKGYRILSLRYKAKSGEIDIIVRKRDLVAFVEVKARRAEGLAIDAVGYETQKRIRAASDQWLSRRRDAHLLTLRYDVVAVLPGRFPKHFQDAF
ncbi:YraN family protein [Neorhizobium sp. JUb45]|uniref:YraN family protein n=1 Tax=unclassified Neorhizobium TaxID=2629175 RepID=UPI00104F1598|nr:YraN family protein [Neorhizobium sp. JUb45]TCR01971.1 putative endonuclease [Neorhizobium sp. JUb45]